MSSVLVRFLGDEKDLLRAAGQSVLAVDRFDKSTNTLGQRVANTGKQMTAFVSVPIVGALTAAGAAAAQEGQEQAVLAGTLERTTGARQADIDSVESWITKQQNSKNFADGELRPALGKLLIAHKDTAKAQDDLSVAMDIATARGISLDSVVTAMSKGAQGSTGALGRLGLATKDAAGETLSYDEILKQAADTMGGAAADAADTAAGRAGITQKKMADLAETVGERVVPAMEVVVDVGGKVADAFDALPGPAKTGIVAIAGIGAAAGPIMTVVGNLGKIVGKLVEVDVAGKRSATTLSKVGVGAAAAAGVAVLALEVNKLRDNVDELHANVEKAARATTDELVAGFLKLGEVVADIHGKQKAANEQLDYFRELAEGNIGTAQRLRDGLADAGHATGEYDRILREAAEAQQRSNDDAERGATVQKDLAGAVGETTEEVDEGSDALDRFAEREKQVEEAAQKTRDEYVKVKEALGETAETTDDLIAKQRDAEDSWHKAEEVVRDYEEALKDAKERLAEAMTPPSPDDLEAAALRLERALIGQGDAIDEVAEAQAELDRLRRQTGSPEEIADAEERVGEARRRHSDASRSQAEAERDLAEARAALEGATRRNRAELEEEVAEAAERLRDANRDQVDATNDLREAQGELDRLRRPATADELADAQRRLEDAIRNQRDATLDLRDAQREQQRVQDEGTDRDPEVVDARRDVERATRDLGLAYDELAWKAGAAKYQNYLLRYELQQLEDQMRRMPDFGSADSRERRGKAAGDKGGGSVVHNHTWTISGAFANDRGFIEKVRSGLSEIMRSNPSLFGDEIPIR